MAEIILFNKPYGVLCQFRNNQSGDEHKSETLADYIDHPGFYPAGRLDKDSEGLVILTDDGALQARITEPRHKLPKTYLVQVEGVMGQADVDRLGQGVELKDGLTRKARVEIIEAPALPPRIPPIRTRRDIPTSWLSMQLVEGRNRQVRRMTAAVGFPTLRLYRSAIGSWTIEGLGPGESRVERVHLPRR